MPRPHFDNIILSIGLQVVSTNGRVYRVGPRQFAVHETTGELKAVRIALQAARMTFSPAPIPPGPASFKEWFADSDMERIGSTARIAYSWYLDRFAMKQAGMIAARAAAEHKHAAE